MHHDQSQRFRVSILVLESGKYAAPVATFMTTGGWSACSPLQGKGLQAEACASFESTHPSHLSLQLSLWLWNDVGELGVWDAGLTFSLGIRILDGRALNGSHRFG